MENWKADVSLLEFALFEEDVVDPESSRTMMLCNNLLDYKTLEPGMNGVEEDAVVGLADGMTEKGLGTIGLGHGRTRLIE